MNMGKLATHSHIIDPMNPQSPTITGAYRESIQINGKERRYICYIPEGVRSAVAGVFVLPDHGVSAQEMYEKSSWANLADTDERKEKFIVFFLEPENGMWKLDNLKEELQYVHEIFLESRGHHKYCVHEAKYYLTGYGAGGAVAQMAAMDDPAVYAGVVSVDASKLDDAFIEENGDMPCTSLNGYEDREGRYGIRKRDLTVPAWIISSKPEDETADSNPARYWRMCAETGEVPRKLRPDVLEYYRTAEAPWTVNQEKEAFRVWISQIKNASADYGNSVNRRIWSEFLRKVRRWMAEPGGDLRMTKDPVTDLGMEYYYEEIDGWMREYYVYVPTSMRNGYKKEVPLVFAMHGYTCSGEIYVGNSEWHKVAEDNGFLVAFPSAVHGLPKGIMENDNPAAKISSRDTELPAWNVMGEERKEAPDELIFFDTMVERICAAHKIDRQRIYATGHSMGSLVTQYLGMSRPNLFAAIAPCSGVLFANSLKGLQEKPAVKKRPDLQIPVWMFGGENEEWLLAAVPDVSNDTGKSIHRWWELNHMTGNKPTDFETYRGTENGRWKDYIFPEQDIPMIRYTWVEAMPHATMTEMSYRIWNEFFSKIRRDSDGTVIYGEI